MSNKEDAILAAQIRTSCNTNDLEVDHIRADEILLTALRNLGYEKTVAEYEKVTRWHA